MCSSYSVSTSDLLKHTQILPDIIQQNVRASGYDESQDVEKFITQCILLATQGGICLISARSTP